MNNNLLVLLCFTLLGALPGAIVLARRRPSVPRQVSLPPPVSDPALPKFQTQAVERLLSLPHFRRLLDGCIFDFYRGAWLEICTCRQLAHPHLILHYGGKQSLVFESADGLSQYVAVQEAVAAQLALGNIAPSSATGER